MAVLLSQTIEHLSRELFTSISIALPGLVAAVLLLSFGYILGLLLGTALKKLLEMTKVCEVLIRRAKITHFMGETQLTGFFGTILKWYVFILFLSPAADLIQLRSLAFFLENIALWVPSLIIAILIGLFGLLMAEYTAVHIRAVRMKGTGTLAHAARVVILLFATLIAVQQIGVNVSLASNAVLIVLGGIMLAVALALGIGFGLALRDEAKPLIRSLRRKR